MSMKMSTPDGTEVMSMNELDTEGNNLLIKVDVLGAMPMTVVLTPAEARKGLALLSLRILIFLVTFLFRR